MVYIITNKKNGTLYVGVTAYPRKRLYEHRHGLIEGFSQKYECKRLVYYEHCPSILTAINREKQIKRFIRLKKIALIESVNPSWEDLYDQISGW